MGYVHTLGNQFLTMEVAEHLLRLVISCFCGTAIGLERSRRYKEAGVRTHVIVCCASALLMIVSKYGFADLTAETVGIRAADGSRIASQVVSGISFLCAGVIIRIDGAIKGLTTAAGLWMTAAIGLTLGAGMYPIGILATVLVVLFQNVLHRITFGNDSTGKNNFQAIVKNGASFVKDAEAFAEAQGGYLREVSVVHTQEITTYQMYIRTKEAIPSDVWQSFIAQHPYIIELQHTYVK